MILHVNCNIDTFSFFFFFNDTATTEIYTLSLHDALPICVTPVGAGGVSALDVTLLAESRLGDPQHVLVVRAVRIVAVGAALVDRRVHPEERAALFGMAGVAGVVERDFLQQRRRGRAVRVVARRARHFPLAQRHVRGAHLLRPLLEVARPAGFDLGRPGELMTWGDFFHHLVATGARHAARLVRAALPEEMGTLGVARGAHGVALFDGRLVVLGERDHPADALASARLDVLLTRAVTILAAHALSGISRLLEEQAAHPGRLELLERLFVAALAGLRADVARRQW